MQTSRNKAFLEDMQTLADSIKHQIYVLSGMSCLDLLLMENINIMMSP